MCFSSNASFVAAGTLAVIGFFTIKASSRVNRLRPLACIPYLFAVQQACEGIVWLTHDNPTSGWLLWSAYIFFGTALILWPTWLPFSIFYAETNTTRKKILLLFLIFGILFSLYAYYLLNTYPLTVSIIGNSISYSIATPQTYEYLRLIAYIVPTVIPFFISSLHYTRIMGIALIASLGISYTIFYATYGSVWCFFAALLSGLLWYVIHRNNTRY